MSNNSRLRKNISKLVTFLLRLGVISYVSSVFYPFINTGLKETGNDWRITWLLATLVFITGIFFLIIKKNFFYLSGFSIVLIICLINTVSSILSETLIQTLYYDFFVITVCIYFLTRQLRIEPREKKKNRKVNVNENV